MMWIQFDQVRGDVQLAERGVNGEVLRSLTPGPGYTENFGGKNLVITTGPDGMAVFRLDEEQVTLSHNSYLSTRPNGGGFKDRDIPGLVRTMSGKLWVKIEGWCGTDEHKEVTGNAVIGVRG